MVLSNIQCEECTGWPHRNQEGKIEIPITCIHHVQCWDKKNGIETFCLKMEKWNAPNS